MLATFIIGLREGLEAALIVSIIATFLRRNGSSLVPLAIGVVCAVTLSIAVGFTLWLVETSLPQAAQEGMETVIGAVAVCFVTGMVLWMNTHARGIKQELEGAAAQALGTGSDRALATMAFLAVLKEGFETAVFLLATFSSSKSTGLAAGGAVLGILCAVALGFGIYSGGVRLNLGRFFTLTAAFLVLVAAGLVVTAIGTAHEAGWLNVGQQRTADLSWLSPPGSIRGALLTGVLGIPAEPVLIQVLGWFAYLIPMALCVLWPARHRPGAAAATRIRLGVAGALALAAVVLALAVSPAQLAPLGPAQLVDSHGRPGGSVRVAGNVAMIETGSARTTMPLGVGRTVAHAEVDDAVLYSEPLDRSAAGLPRTLTLDQLAAMNGGELPVGFSLELDPGPFQASWVSSGQRQLWLVGGEVLDYDQRRTTAVTLTGGGLTTSRTVVVAGSAPGGVAVGASTLAEAPRRLRAAQSAAAAQLLAQADRNLWRRTVPRVLAIAAVLVLLRAARGMRLLLPRRTRAVTAENLAE